MASDNLVAWVSGRNGTTRGPAWQDGSTAGADANDPTFAAGEWTCGTDDYRTAGNVLSSTISGAAGFTVAMVGNLASADLTNARALLSKYQNSSAAEFAAYTIGGSNIRLEVNYGGGTANRTDYATTGAPLTAGRQLLAASYDPALARASRGAWYRNGAAVATGGTAVGTDGTPAATAAELRAGMTHSGLQGIGGFRDYGIWNRPLTAQEHADLYAWAQGEGLV